MSSALSRWGRWPAGVAVAWIAAISSVGSAAAPVGDPFVEDKSGVTIDWRRGVIEASGGAAADQRMPSADAARPGAERRARVAARARIAEALRVLPMGGGHRLDESSVTRAVGRARLKNIEYQSNGGAVVRMEIAFGDWAQDASTQAIPGGASDDGGAKAGASPASARAPIALLLPEGHLAAAPVIVIGGREIALGPVHYVPSSGLPQGVSALTVHSDRQGRLLLEDRESTREQIAGRPATIYLQKILR